MESSLALFGDAVQVRVQSAEAWPAKEFLASELRVRFGFEGVGFRYRFGVERVARLKCLRVSDLV